MSQDSTLKLLKHPNQPIYDALLSYPFFHAPDMAKECKDFNGFIMQSLSIAIPVSAFESAPAARRIRSCFPAITWFMSS